MVWDANVLVTSIVNNAIVPLMTLPVIDSKVNQLVVEHKDGACLTIPPSDLSL